VPRLQLYLDHVDTRLALRYLEPNGGVSEIPCLRLITYANLFAQLVHSPLAADYGICRCFIDTGAFISIIPETIWQFLRPGVVTPLPFDPTTPPNQRQLIIAGGTFPFELGRLTLKLEDRSRATLNLSIVAKLTRDGGRLPIPLTLGLRGGFLEGRTLQAVPDATAPFGQAWTLTEL